MSYNYSCRICGAQNLVILRRATYYLSKPSGTSVFRCKRCGTITSNDPVHPAVYEADYYQRCEAYTANLPENQQRNRLFQSRVSFLRQHEGIGRVLDIGCAYGDFLRHAREAGFITYGIDISFSALNHSHNRGNHTVQALGEHLPFADNTFIAIHMNHVLEHLADPVSAVKEIYRVLVPKGLCIIEVPSELGPLAMRLNLLEGRLGRPGTERWTYTPHLTYFDLRSLRALVQRAGLTLVREQVRYYSPISPMLRTIPARLARHYDVATQSGDLLEIVVQK